MQIKNKVTSQINQSYQKTKPTVYTLYPNNLIQETETIQTNIYESKTSNPPSKEDYQNLYNICDELYKVNQQLEYSLKQETYNSEEQRIQIEILKKGLNNNFKSCGIQQYQQWGGKEPVDSYTESLQLQKQLNEKDQQINELQHLLKETEDHSLQLVYQNQYLTQQQQEQEYKNQILADEMNELTLLIQKEKKENQELQEQNKELKQQQDEQLKFFEQKQQNQHITAQEIREFERELEETKLFAKELELQKQIAEQAKQELKTKLIGLEQINKDLSNQLHQLQKKYTNSIKEIEVMSKDKGNCELLQKQLLQTEFDLEQAKSEISNLLTTIQAHKNYEQLEQDYEQLKQETNEIMNQKNEDKLRHEKERQSKAEEIKQLFESQSLSKQQMRKLQEQIEQLEQENTNLNEEKQILEGNNSELKEKLDLMQQEFEECWNQFEKNNLEAQEIFQNNENLSQDKKQLSKQNQELHEQINQFTNEQRNWKQEKVQLKQELQVKDSEIYKREKNCKQQKQEQQFLKEFSSVLNTAAIQLITSVKQQLQPLTTNPQLSHFESLLVPAALNVEFFSFENLNTKLLKNYENQFTEQLGLIQELILILIKNLAEISQEYGQDQQYMERNFEEQFEIFFRENEQIVQDLNQQLIKKDQKIEEIQKKQFEIQEINKKQIQEHQTELTKLKTESQTCLNTSKKELKHLQQATSQKQEELDYQLKELQIKEQEYQSLVESSKVKDIIINLLKKIYISERDQQELIENYEQINLTINDLEKAKSELFTELKQLNLEKKQNQSSPQPQSLLHLKIDKIQDHLEEITTNLEIIYMKKQTLEKELINLQEFLTQKIIRKGSCDYSRVNSNLKIETINSFNNKPFPSTKRDCSSTVKNSKLQFYQQQPNEQQQQTPGQMSIFYTSMKQKFKPIEQKNYKIQQEENFELTSERQVKYRNLEEKLANIMVKTNIKTINKCDMN